MQLASDTDLQNPRLGGQIVFYSSAVPYSAELSHSMMPHQCCCSLQLLCLRRIPEPDTTLCERRAGDRGDPGDRYPQQYRNVLPPKALAGKQPGINGPGQSGLEEKTVTPFLRRQRPVGACFGSGGLLFHTPADWKLMGCFPRKSWPFPLRNESQIPRSSPDTISRYYLPMLLAASGLTPFSSVSLEKDM